MAYSINSSWLAVCNSALVRLNKQQMQSLDEATTSANACSVALPNAVSSVLAQNDWKSARKRAKIPAYGVGPDFGFSYRYMIPNDFVRLVSVENADEWEREGGFILSDTGPDLHMIYIAYPTQPGYLDPLIQEAIICTLAANLAMSLISDSSVVASWQSKAELAIARAKLNEQAGEKDIYLDLNDIKGSM